MSVTSVPPEESSGVCAQQVLAFRAYGLRIGIRVFDGAPIDSIIERFPPGSTPIAPTELDRCFDIEQTQAGSRKQPHPGVEMSVNGRPLGWAESPELLLDAIESHLQRYVAEFADPFLFVHSGVVQWHGSVILLPGKSFAGKSTLVAALVEAGATYFSDEYAVVDHDGWVRPYARQVSLREGPFGPDGRLDLSMHAPQGNDAEIPVPIDIVLFTRFQEEAEWTTEKLGHGASVMALCQQTVAIQRRPADALTILGKVADSAVVYRGTRGDLQSAISWLETMVSGSHRG